jgi:hypothetical protein
VTRAFVAISIGGEATITVGITGRSYLNLIEFGRVADIGIRVGGPFVSNRVRIEGELCIGDYLCRFTDRLLQSIVIQCDFTFDALRRLRGLRWFWRCLTSTLAMARPFEGVVGPICKGCWICSFKFIPDPRPLTVDHPVDTIIYIQEASAQRGGLRKHSVQHLWSSRNTLIGLQLRVRCPLT